MGDGAELSCDSRDRRRRAGEVVLAAVALARSLPVTSSRRRVSRRLLRYSRPLDGSCKIHVCANNGYLLRTKTRMINPLREFLEQPSLPGLAAIVAVIGGLSATIVGLRRAWARLARRRTLHRAIRRWKRSYRDDVLLEALRRVAFAPSGIQTPDERWAFFLTRYEESPVHGLMAEPTSVLRQAVTFGSFGRLERRRGLSTHSLGDHEGSLLLLGEAGIGKSTKLLHFALYLCTEDELTVPIWLDLREAADSQRLNSPTFVKDVKALLEHATDVSNDSPCFNAIKAHIRVCVFVDSLDEAADLDQSIRSINQLAGGHQDLCRALQLRPDQIRFIIACRRNQYLGRPPSCPLLRPLLFRALELRPLTEDSRIRLLSHNLGATLEYAGQLYRSNALIRPDLGEFWGRPLQNLLLSEAILDIHGGALPLSPSDVKMPKNIWAVYESSLRWRITRECHRASFREVMQGRIEFDKTGDTADSFVEAVVAHVFRLCARLAWEQHRAATDLRQCIRQIVKAERPGSPWTSELGEFALVSSNILSNGPGGYLRFFHESVREFFVAFWWFTEGLPREPGLFQKLSHWPILVFYVSGLGDDEEKLRFLMRCVEENPSLGLWLLAKFPKDFTRVQHVCAEAMLREFGRCNLARQAEIMAELLDSGLPPCQEAAVELYRCDEVPQHLKYAVSMLLPELKSVHAVRKLGDIIEDPDADSRWEALFAVLKIAAGAGRSEDPVAHEAKTIYERWHMRRTKAVGFCRAFYNMAEAIQRLRLSYAARILENGADAYRRWLGNLALPRYTRQEKGDVCRPPTWHPGIVTLGNWYFRKFRTYALSREHPEPDCAIMFMTYIPTRSVLRFARALVVEDCPAHLRRHRWAAAFVLAHIRHPDAADALWRFFTEPNNPKAFYGAWGWSHQLDSRPTAVARAVAYCRGRAHPCRPILVRCLGRLIRDTEDDRVRSELIGLCKEALSEDDAEMRWAALQAMHDSCERYGRFLDSFVGVLRSDECEPSVRSQAEMLFLDTTDVELADQLAILVGRRAEVQEYRTVLDEFFPLRKLDETCTKPTAH